MGLQKTEGGYFICQEHLMEKHLLFRDTYSMEAKIVDAGAADECSGITNQRRHICTV